MAADIDQIKDHIEEHFTPTDNLELAKHLVEHYLTDAQKVALLRLIEEELKKP